MNKFPCKVTEDGFSEMKFVVPAAVELNCPPKNDSAAVGLVTFVVKLDTVPVPTAKEEDDPPAEPFAATVNCP